MAKLEYKIVWGANVDEVSTQVTSLLSQGWELHGNVMAAALPLGFYVYQAMVRPTI